MGAAVCTLFYILPPDGFSSHLAAFMLLAIATAVLTILALRALHTLKAARLIAENELLRVYPALIKTEDGVQTDGAAIEVSISCFGILLDTRVVRFNRKSNRLRRVEIGRNMIVLIYGPDAQMKKMIILHEPMNEKTAQSIAQRFRFETGAETALQDHFESG